jgi:biopolymer transport protein ExbD
MRTRPSMLVLIVIMVLTAALLQYGAKVYGASGERAPQPAGDTAAPVVTEIRAAQPAEAQPAISYDVLEARMRRATVQAAAADATISVAVLDRVTHQMVTNGNTENIVTASVAKLFIADDLLRGLQQNTKLSADDRAALDVMLRSSDDGAAEKFWNLGGGSAIITRVANRYGLTGTKPGYDGAWWNTISTAPNLARYYEMLLDGSGGLPAELANIIIEDLAHSTPTGLDGYPQRFGIPEGLYAEPVAVKQGWMPCVGNNWMHLSTGVVGPQRRYVTVIESLQPTDEDTARATITQAVKTVFPNGRV